MNPRSKSGFTLIELSIVLVIIGLLVGGVLAGKAMIQAAEMRHAYGDLVRYESAMYTFKNKYACLPGDCANASTFFPPAPDCNTVAINYDQTCNGNGNGSIDFYYPNNNAMEQYFYWQQLSLASLISGKFAFNNPPPYGFGHPRMSWGGTSVSIVKGYSGSLPQDNRHYYVIGGYARGATMLWTWDNIIPAADALAFDQKFDDGVSNRGRIQGGNVAYAPFSDTPCRTGSNYAVASFGTCYLSYDLFF